MLDTVTDRRLSGRRAGVAGGESWLKALAIIRVAAEQETEKRHADRDTTTKTNEYLKFNTLQTNNRLINNNVAFCN